MKYKIMFFKNESEFRSKFYGTNGIAQGKEVVFYGIITNTEQEFYLVVFRLL